MAQYLRERAAELVGKLRGEIPDLAQYPVTVINPTGIGLPETPLVSDPYLDRLQDSFGSTGEFRPNLLVRPVYPSDGSEYSVSFILSQQFYPDEEERMGIECRAEALRTTSDEKVKINEKALCGILSNGDHHIFTVSMMGFSMRYVVKDGELIWMDAHQRGDDSQRLNYGDLFRDVVGTEYDGVLGIDEGNYDRDLNTKGVDPRLMSENSAEVFLDDMLKKAVPLMVRWLDSRG